MTTGPRCTLKHSCKCTGNSQAQGQKRVLFSFYDSHIYICIQLRDEDGNQAIILLSFWCSIARNDWNSNFCIAPDECLPSQPSTVSALTYAKDICRTMRTSQPQIGIHDLIGTQLTWDFELSIIALIVNYISNPSSAGVGLSSSSDLEILLDIFPCLFLYSCCITRSLWSASARLETWGVQKPSLCSDRFGHCWMALQNIDSLSIDGFLSDCHLCATSARKWFRQGGNKGNLNTLLFSCHSPSPILVNIFNTQSWSHSFATLDILSIQ